ncbi:MAG: hypothetical protein ABSH08_09745 [Tepidisphaeraceae bacterium]
MTITIPKAAGSSPGVSWAAAAAFSFLTVTFIAQGILSGNLLWTGAGFFCFLITGWQMLALRGLPTGKSGQTKLQITPDQLAKITGPANAPQRQQWPRSAVTDIRVDPESDSTPPGLSLVFNDGKPPVCILSGADPAELNWIAEEIHLKWGMASTDSVASAGS